MIRALAIKELRETAWIGLVGLGVYLLLVGMIASPSLERSVAAVPGLNVLVQSMYYSFYGASLPFLGGRFLSAYACISVALVLALGYRQSVGETLGGTFCLLLHRPLDRTRVLVTKMAVGIGLFLVLAAVPVLVYAWWAATPGTHPSPFEWSMTYGSWKVWIAMPILYFGAFLSGLRPGRWRGTRLMPLAAAGVATLGAALLPLWLISGLPILLVASTFAVVSILWVGTVRDYS
jgi:hypothetical protein